MKQVVILLSFFLSSGCLLAQSISGTITDSKTNPVAGAEIIDLKTGNHTHSDEQGEFSFEPVALGDTIKVSRLGFESKTLVIIEFESNLQIVLNLRSILLEEVVISKKLNAINVLSEVDLEVNPVNSSQEILRQVPGLIIGQHAGGGKAEQIFLRGFDIDHGTDINITADGIPVNMVSHAHGQGYADLHFVIPETIDKIDFGKGPYYAEKGDFTTAGYVDFNTKTILDNSSVSFEAGQFNTFRSLGMFNLVNSLQNKTYLATEYISSDGPFESPQNFHRFNIFGKSTSDLSSSDRVVLTFSNFNSNWDASGQIPQRAVDNGQISRFGAIDSTEGGTTSRTNFIIDYKKQISKKQYITNKFFYSYYNFELYSNFTFFLDDTINGDQIKQKENRSLYGLSSIYHHDFSNGEITGMWRGGISLRNDQSKNNELSHTLNRQETLEIYKLGDIIQSNLAGFVDANISIGKWTINPALRFDYFDFQYYDKLLENYLSQTTTSTFLSPKLNLFFNYSNDLQIYLKTGRGFHSNDARVAIPQNGKEILPAALGADLGFIWKPYHNWLINAALWQLNLEQEFVYVGDAGIVEPSGKTKRRGVDLSMRYQPFKWLFANVDATYTHARATEESPGEDFIPLAPDFTLTGGVNTIFQSGFYSGVHFRHIDDRPANEDNSIVAVGYTVFDLNMGYSF